MDNLKQLLKEVHKYAMAKQELSIFSIGGKGHYENPISDILAFFLNSKAEHGFGTIFLKSYFKILLKNNKFKTFSGVDFLYDNVTIEREVITKDSKRIDILLRSNEWALMIENKIFHEQVNPFESYEEYGKNLDVPVFYSILSPSGNSVKENWIPVSYKKYLKELKDDLGSSFLKNQFSKWSILAREFILHLENLLEEQKMDAEQINFIEGNLESINQINKLHDKYITHTQEYFKKELKDQTTLSFISKYDSNWPAIRFYCDKWGNYNNIVLRLPSEETDQLFSISIYIYDVGRYDFSLFNKSFKNFNLENRDEKRWKCWAINNTNYNFTSSKAALDEMIKLVKIISKITK